MSENRSAYQIDIKTTADVAAAGKTTDSLKDVKSAAEGVGSTLEEAGKKGETAHEKNTEGAHKTELSHRER